MLRDCFFMTFHVLQYENGSWVLCNADAGVIYTYYTVRLIDMYYLSLLALFGLAGCE